ncbi:MAG: hypothetical protein ACRCX2_07865 [Paraclostridium sp.]
MKKNMAILLLMVCAILEAKSFSSRSGSSRSFSSSSRSSSSSSRSSSSVSRPSSSTSRVSNPRPATKTTSNTRVNTTKTSNTRVNSSKTTNTNVNKTTIINNNTNVNRGGGLDVLDVVILNSVLNSNRPTSTHTTETVYVEKAPVVHEQVRTEKVVTRTDDTSIGGFLAGMIMLLLFVAVLCFIF